LFLFKIKLHLKSKEQHERHHKTEETHGLGQSKAQDGVREELLLKTWIASVADDQTAKDRANTSSGACNAHGGRASTDILGGRVNVVSKLSCVNL
jgi:hypothetical protein